jgi:hypothetical protein
MRPIYPVQLQKAREYHNGYGEVIGEGTCVLCHGNGAMWMWVLSQGEAETDYEDCPWCVDGIVTVRREHELY